MNKKLQVFVSSSYTDLIEERQAAVQAILDAGHIPAGMELFKAGNESQLKTIYKWIDESDVYMLILGGRYGSIESNSGKSYTQLEYEYALNKNIPVFAVVLSESFLTTKINLLGLSDVMEQKSPDKYQYFKSLVMSKVIREVDDCKDIKINIHSTLNEFIHDYNLGGWIKNYRSYIKNNNLLQKLTTYLKNIDLSIDQTIRCLNSSIFNDTNFGNFFSIFSNDIGDLNVFFNENFLEFNFLSFEFNLIFTIHECLLEKISIIINKGEINIGDNSSINKLLLSEKDLIFKLLTELQN